MATTTPNYGWPVPTSTDYVKDGATAIEALGDAIDSTVFGLSSGLNLIKTQTIGTGVSSVSVTGAFSTTYDTYKIMLVGGTGTNSRTIFLALNGSTTQYYFVMAYEGYASGGGVVRGNNLSSFNYVGNSQTAQLSMTCELMNPFLATNTLINAWFTDPSISGVMSGFLNNTTSHTAFTLNAESGATFTGGTIYVYGYKK